MNTRNLQFEIESDVQMSYEINKAHGCGDILDLLIIAH